ncbi:MAG TPA: hypothetical protein VF988_15830 [Verrucomicrobiae bacterium]
MKTIKLVNWVAVGMTCLAADVTRLSADTSVLSAQPEKNYSGTVISVAPQDRMVTVKAGWLSTKIFNLGDNCAFAMLDNNNGSVNDLRVGEKIAVRYQATEGVNVADRITQQPLQFTGMVTVMDTTNQILVVHRRGLDKQMVIANGCKVTLRDNRAGSFGDVQPGSHVTVTYEMPNDVLTARQITQTSSQFAGTLTAIDLAEKTVKARAFLDNKKFNVADNCAIVIDGRTNGKLSDLRPNERLLFSYDQINGVNVVNRIAPAPPEAPRTNAPMTTSMPNRGGSSYPTYPAY